MGIRGTTVLARIETVNGAVTTEVTLVRDANGDLGRMELRGLDGSLIQTIDVTDTRWEVTTEDGETFSVERSPVDENDDRAIIADAILAAQSAANRVAAGNTFVTLPSASGTPGRMVLRSRANLTQAATLTVLMSRSSKTPTKDPALTAATVAAAWVRKRQQSCHSCKPMMSSCKAKRMLGKTAESAERFPLMVEGDLTF